MHVRLRDQRRQRLARRARRPPPGRCPASRAIARSWMSSTPSSTLPLVTSLSESGPAPGLRIFSRVAGHVDRRVHRVGHEVERDRHRLRRRRGLARDVEPHAGDASTASSSGEASHAAHDRSLCRRGTGTVYCRADDRLRGPGRRPRVPDVHRHRPRRRRRAARLPGRLHDPGQHRPAALHRLPLAQQPHATGTGGDAAVLGVHAVPADAADLAELFGGETGDESTSSRAAPGTTARSGVPILDRCENWFVGRVLRASTPATTTRSCSSRSPGRPATRTSSRSTAPSGSIPDTRPDLTVGWLTRANPRPIVLP